MSSLLQRYRRHPTASRFILYIFLGWLLLYSLSSWIDLFQGFETLQVLSEWAEGFLFGVLVLVFIGVPLWLLLTYFGEKKFAKEADEVEQSEEFDDMEWPDDL